MDEFRTQYYQNAIDFECLLLLKNELSEELKIIPKNYLD